MASDDALHGATLPEACTIDEAFAFAFACLAFPFGAIVFEPAKLRNRLQSIAMVRQYVLSQNGYGWVLYEPCVAAASIFIQKSFPYFFQKGFAVHFLLVFLFLNNFRTDVWRIAEGILGGFPYSFGSCLGLF